MFQTTKSKNIRKNENQKKKLDLEFGDLDAKRREFEREKEAFDEMYRQWQERSGDKKKKQKASLFWIFVYLVPFGTNRDLKYTLTLSDIYLESNETKIY